MSQALITGTTDGKSVYCKNVIRIGDTIYQIISTSLGAGYFNIMNLNEGFTYTKEGRTIWGTVNGGTVIGGAVAYGTNILTQSLGAYLIFNTQGTVDHSEIASRQFQYNTGYGVGGTLKFGYSENCYQYVTTIGDFGYFCTQVADPQGSGTYRACIKRVNLTSHTVTHQIKLRRDGVYFQQPFRLHNLNDKLYAVAGGRIMRLNPDDLSVMNYWIGDGNFDMDNRSERLYEDTKGYIYLVNGAVYKFTSDLSNLLYRRKYQDSVSGSGFIYIHSLEFSGNKAYLCGYHTAVGLWSRLCMVGMDAGLTANNASGNYFSYTGHHIGAYTFFEDGLMHLNALTTSSSTPSIRNTSIRCDPFSTYATQTVPYINSPDAEVIGKIENLSYTEDTITKLTGSEIIAEDVSYFKSATVDFSGTFWQRSTLSLTPVTYASTQIADDSLEKSDFVTRIVGYVGSQKQLGYSPYVMQLTLGGVGERLVTKGMETQDVQSDLLYELRETGEHKVYYLDANGNKIYID